MRRCSPHCGSGGSRAGAEQQVVDLRLQLVEERNQDLTGARAANRELMARLNAAERHLSRSLPSIHQLLSCAGIHHCGDLVRGQGGRRPFHPTTADNPLPHHHGD